MHAQSASLRASAFWARPSQPDWWVFAAPADSSSTPPGSPPGDRAVVPSGLNQPKKLTVSPHGDLIVALSGDGNAPASCTDGNEPSCLDTSGAIDRVTPWGDVTTLIGGLPSVSGGAGPGSTATGPAEGAVVDGRLQVLFQNTNIDPTTGLESYGTAGRLLGDLVRFPPWGPRALGRGELRALRSRQQP